MKIRCFVGSFALAAVLAVTSACVLAVDFAKPGGSHCRFNGADTACGQCLADRCSAVVDACCLDDACGGAITDVEVCATSSGVNCTHLADPGDRGGAHADLSACFVKQCASACGFDADAGPPGPAHHLTHCGPSYVTSIDTCECDIGQSAPNDTTCTEVGHPALRCCAPDGWPGDVRTCECKKVICFGAAAGCVCELGAMDDQMRATDCTGNTCCYDPMLNSCACGTAPCHPEETKVASCSIAVLGCPSGLHHVDSCDVPKP